MRTDQIQTLVFGGMSRLAESAIVLVRFLQDGNPQQHLLSLASQITFGLAKRGENQVVQLGITPRGLAALGIPQASMPFAFRDPLASDHHRRVLGDSKESAPENWLWNGDDVDLVLLIYASSPQLLNELDARVTARFERVAATKTILLDDSREHFGFRDGMSNPRMLPDGALSEVPVGEFVLGYPDVTGEIPPSLHHAGFDFGRDGSYLVVRQLAQDVVGFWRALQSADADPVRLAAKLIGRWPDGRALTDTESFADDPHGLSCPRGAHIRRANPRDAIPSSVDERRRHRILRRGRPYGPPAPPDVYPPGVAVTAGSLAPSANAERGLMFVCLCADLARQFEHVQQSWLNNAKHDGMYDEICPISSAAGTVGDGRRFTVPRYPVRRRLHNWPTAVQVRGAAYTLLVGRDALLRLCTREENETSRFERLAQ